MKVTATWPVVTAKSNFPMALDEANHRLFVGCRRPAKVLVFDTGSGKEIASFDTVGDTDDLFYDARANVYTSAAARDTSTSFRMAVAIHSRAALASPPHPAPGHHCSPPTRVGCTLPFPIVVVRKRRYASSKRASDSS